MKKKIFQIFSLSLIMCYLLTGCGNSAEKIAATDAFKTETSRIEGQLAERDSVVKSAEELIAASKQALDETLTPTLETAVSSAKAVTFEIPKIPSGIEEINKVTKELKAIDNSAVITAVINAQKNLENSIKQYEQVTAPKESFVIERLKKVTYIADISAVTEDNDPNGKLNKAGGYTAQIYFSSKLVDQSKAVGKSIIEKGTACGGSIEVYSTADEANKRNTYLASFDGSVFASGSHKVIGSVIVRTSDLLMASKQKELEASIVEALTALPE